MKERHHQHEGMTNSHTVTIYWADRMLCSTFINRPRSRVRAPVALVERRVCDGSGRGVHQNILVSRSSKLGSQPANVDMLRCSDERRRRL